MEISDLHRELGRSISEGAKLRREELLEGRRHNEDIQALQRAYSTRISTIADSRERSETRVQELQEAIRLAEEGMDPTLAKLRAKESLEDQESQGHGLITTKGSATIGGNMALYGNLTSRIAAEETTRSVTNSALSARITSLESRIASDTSR